jgi:hypothetical protein
MTEAQVLAIILSTVGGIAMMLAMTNPNFDRWFADWRLRTGTGVLGFLILIAGIVGAFYFAEKPKTLVVTGRDAVGRGADAARDGMRRMKEALPQTRGWWPWGDKSTEKK